MGKTVYQQFIHLQPEDVAPRDLLTIEGVAYNLDRKIDLCAKNDCGLILEDEVAIPCKCLNS